MKLSFDNRFVNELPADPIEGSSARRQVNNACYSLIDPTKVKAPAMVSYSKEAASLIDLSESDCQSDLFLQTFVGNEVLEGMQPHAMCYGGHQFGNWAGQLGDGRAINLGDALNQKGEHWTLQLKGSGATPYSRSADGLAVLRSSIREYLCSEAMFHLGVPTTRALSLIITGEEVMRDMLYDGHPDYELGAVVCRMAPSFIRFGNFQIFASRDQIDELRQLTDYTIRHHFPTLLEIENDKPRYVALFEQVCQLSVEMVVHWMCVGFVHGVMNTDNLSILGLTIDYGPYGWLDNFDPQWTPNTTDAQNRRYRYGQQPNIVLWNCYQLANALYPLIGETEPLEQALHQLQENYQTQWRQMMGEKLGLGKFKEGDELLFDRLEALLARVETDMTIFYRILSNHTEINLEALSPAYYEESQLDEDYRQAMQTWLADYQKRLEEQSGDVQQRLENMRQHNPKYVFRNYLAQQAIDKAEQGDHSMVNELLELFRRPYDEQPEFEHYAAKRPDWARTKVGCSMLSCSS